MGDFPGIKRGTALVSLLSGANHYLKTESGIPQGRPASLENHSHSLTTDGACVFRVRHRLKEDLNSFCRFDCVSIFEGGWLPIASTSILEQCLHFEAERLVVILIMVSSPRTRTRRWVRGPAGPRGMDQVSSGHSKNLIQSGLASKSKGRGRSSLIVKVKFVFHFKSKVNPRCLGNWR